MKKLLLVLAAVFLVGCLSRPTETVPTTSPLPTVTLTPQIFEPIETQMATLAAAAPEIPFELPEVFESTEVPEETLPGEVVDGLINQAVAGEEIVLGEGIYVVSECLAIDRSLTIRGQGSGKTLLLVAESDCILRFDGGEGSRLVLEGITFQNVAVQTSINVIEIQSGSFEISDSIFIGAKTLSNSKQDLHAAILVSGRAEGRVDNSLFAANDWSAGILAVDQSQIAVANSYFLGGVTGNRFGVVAFDGAEVSIADSRFHGLSVGVLANDRSKMKVERATLILNLFGVAFVDQASGLVTDSYFSENRLAAIQAAHHARVEVSGNNIGRNQYGVDIQDFGQIAKIEENVYYENYGADISSRIQIPAEPPVTVRESE